MAGDSAETSNKSNKSFYSTVFVLFFISKLYLKKFIQFSLGVLLESVLYYFQAFKIEIFFNTLSTTIKLGDTFQMNYILLFN